MKKFDQVHTKVKFRSFGKVTLGGKQKVIEKTLPENDENEEKKAKKILQLQIEDT